MPIVRRLPDDFSRNAAYPLFTFDLAADRAWILHFAPEDYRQASFLDQRALGHREIPGWTVSRSELTAAIEPGPRLPLHWLFHIGHCGSTLFSRLLDLTPGLLGLREPLPLLALAQVDAAARAAWQPAIVSLLARGFSDTLAVVVKPTSIVSTLAEELLGASTGHACLLWVDLHTWLASMLRDRGLVASVRSTEHLRLARFAAEDWAKQGAAGNDGILLARAWLAEQLRWRTITGGSPAGRFIDMDFAEVLTAPAACTSRLISHYGLTVPADWPVRIAASGLLGRYAKDDALPFDPTRRRQEIAEASRRHADAIADGLRWAEQTIKRLGLEDLTTRLRPVHAAP